MTAKMERQRELERQQRESERQLEEKSRDMKEFVKTFNKSAIPSLKQILIIAIILLITIIIDMLFPKLSSSNTTGKRFAGCLSILS